MQQLREWKNRHIIKVLTGMRRSGKSTMLEMLADELRRNESNDQVQFYNFEDLNTLAIGDIINIHTHITEKMVADKMNYIFLDEVQNVKDFERLVDSLFIRKNVDLYVTGSNAYLLSGELATLLTGRYIEISILPFSFSEYYEYTNLVNSEKLSKNESFRNFISNGGIPQMVKESIDSIDLANDVLKGIMGTIIEKDVFARHDIYNKHIFNKVLDFVTYSVGSMISPNSISTYLKSEKVEIDSRTVAYYLDYLTETYLLYRVPRYDVKGKHLLQTLDKYYLSDVGFRKIRIGKKTTEDIGHLLENIVYLELRRNYPEVYIGKLRDKEIDFVVVDRKGYISYYQVAYSTMENSTLERELAPLKAIRDSNQKYLLTMDYDLNPVYDGIRKLNVIDWLLETK
ncbi:MAG: ATP-binding protein [Bacteroidales bacterium]|jgi:predicted AAA+ superfamily ATPase|nr:ATP-binding protein [Bacteroidales bacterium]